LQVVAAVFGCSQKPAFYRIFDELCMILHVMARETPSFVDCTAVYMSHLNSGNAA